MHFLGKLLGSYILGRRSTSFSPLIYPLISRITMILCLVIISAILIGVLIVSLCLLAYQLLLSYSLSQPAAFAILAGALSVLGLLTLLWLRDAIRELRATPLYVDVPPRFIRRIRHVGESFLDGLLHPTVR